MPRSRSKLLLMAIVLSVLLVVAGNLATNLVVDGRLLVEGAFGSIDAPDVAVLHFIFTALPMVVLALVGSRSRALWLTAFLLGGVFWIYWVFQLWRDSLAGFEGGANIGLGLIMIASPIFILVILGLVAFVRTRLLAHRS